MSLEEERDKEWFSEGSLDYIVLSDIIYNDTFLKDLR